ncbi:MAG: DNA-binding protein [Candidatus Melainabacteria bacterium RIFCSPLOWO2_02_FULL_35_15]|nr:MAG: DNA-binding protein [Candidatus Melainabacteria bacterium RIFCSPLOWO2_12_FULL_35_11]OGI13126.1 MAG: DNA-binding protein [Candidatus Melainabacteria bacterium RIFCSPLOWO2_02_FULL_35_15]
MMNKAELIKLIANKTGTSKKQSEECIDLVINAITRSVAKGEKVTLVGFGTFERRDRRARKGRDPRSGAAIDIPAKKVPAFSAGKQFKQAVNKK